MAEREGFEPSEHVSAHLISSQARSASSGTSPIISLLYSLNPASSGSLDFIRRIPVPRPSGVALQRAIWLPCQIVDSSPLLRAVTLGIHAFRDTCPSLDIVPALRPIGRPSAVPNCSRHFGQTARHLSRGLKF